ncbi:hypothetical protein [Hydrogenophaga atypica]|uniref:Tripartite tricarboxylate transporter family receptor n=1 Tax=Hydrogenophaga atypica TaxID=249409 RepID=A0ABW2QRN3_9BURK
MAQQVLADPGLRKKLADLGISASGESAEVLRKFMAAESDRYKAVIKAANIKPE